MARPSFLDAVQELQRSANPETQIVALKHLKNAAIGHPEKKGEFIRHGIVVILARALQGTEKFRDKRRDQVSNGAPGDVGKTSVWAEEDEVRLQALLLLASIAQGISSPCLGLELR